MGLSFNIPDVTRPQHLGSVVLAARNKMGMTQQALAYLAGTTPDAISAIESGKRSPEWPTLARIAAVLQIPMGMLDSAVEHEVAAARKPQPESPDTDRALREQRKRMRKRHTER